MSSGCTWLSFSFDIVHSVSLATCMITCIHHYSMIEYFQCPRSSLCSVSSLIPPRNHWHPLIFLLSLNFAFSRMSYSWTHTTVQFVKFSDWLLSFNNTHLSSSISFHGLTAYFFSALKDIPLSQCTTVQAPTTSKFGNYEKSQYKNPCAGFCVSIAFQPVWINTKECNCWIIRRSVFHFA